MRTLSHAALALLLTSLSLAGSGCAADRARPRADAARGADAMPAVAPRDHLRPVADAVRPERLRADIDHLAAFGTRHTLSATDDPFRGIGAARRWISDEFEKAAAARAALGLPPMRVFFDAHALPPDGRRIDREVEIVNVIAVIPGRLSPSGRAERIYISGHYDSRNSDEMDRTGDAPGANDDASGTALVIEAARVLAMHRFDHEVWLVAFDAEEAGLYGARRHVERAAAEGARIRAVLNNDIVGDPTGPDGSVHDMTVRIFSDGVPSTAAFGGDALAGRAGGATLIDRLRRESALGDSGSRQLARFVQEVARAMRPERGADGFMPTLVFRPDRFLRGGDHTPFHDAGYPAVRFTEYAEDYNRQHQDVRTENGVRYGDLPEFVDERYLARVAALNLAAAAALADAPSTPADARIIAAALDNSTTVRWSRSPEDDVAGYEVVWRDTTSPFWTHRLDAGDAEEAVVPVSKDNAFFGVRAYNRRGHRSIVAFAFAARE